MLEKSFGLLFFLKQTRNQQQREKSFIWRSPLMVKQMNCPPKEGVCRPRGIPLSVAPPGKETTQELNRYLDALKQQIYQEKENIDGCRKGSFIASLKRHHFRRDWKAKDDPWNFHAQMKALEGIVLDKTFFNLGWELLLFRAAAIVQSLSPLIWVIVLLMNFNRNKN